MYKNIDSKFILEKLKHINWSDHGYIDQLIKLDQFIRIPPVGYLSAMHYQHLRNTYKTEFLALCREKSESKFKYELSMIEINSLLKSRANSMASEDESKNKKEWLAVGGRL